MDPADPPPPPSPFELEPGVLFSIRYFILSLLIAGTLNFLPIAPFLVHINLLKDGHPPLLLTFAASQKFLLVTLPLSAFIGIDIFPLGFIALWA